MNYNSEDLVLTHCTNYYENMIEKLRFDEYLDEDDFVGWIQNIKDTFECMEIPAEKQVKCVSQKLQGMARA